jgi:DNA-binding transcriptional ArsR family regulator
LRRIDINRNFTIKYIQMGSTKSEEFSVKDNRIATYAKAMAHPARVAILRLLIQRQACVCGDIVEELPLSQSTVSQHLKELKEAGLIKGDIEGARVCYCIDDQEMNAAKTAILGLFTSYEVQKNKCC